MRPFLYENYNKTRLARVLSRQKRFSPIRKGMAPVRVKEPYFTDPHFRVVNRGLVSLVTEPQLDKWECITRTKEPEDQETKEFGISYSNKYIVTQPFLDHGLKNDSTSLDQTFFVPRTSNLDSNQHQTACLQSVRQQLIFQKGNKTIYDEARPIDLGQENIQQPNDFVYIPQPASPLQIVDTKRQKVESGVDLYFDTPEEIQFTNQYESIEQNQVQSKYQNLEQQFNRRNIFYQKQSAEYTGQHPYGPIKLPYQLKRQENYHQRSVNLVPHISNFIQQKPNKVVNFRRHTQLVHDFGNIVVNQKHAVENGIARRSQPIANSQHPPLQIATEEGRNLLKEQKKERECEIGINLPVEQVRLTKLIAEARTKISQARRSAGRSQVKRESSDTRPAGLREWREDSEGRREERGWLFGEKVAKNIVRLRESQY